LIPNWAKDPKIAYKTINARVETVDTAPSYRQAFKKRRWLIPADTFYEWKKVVGGKIPYAIGMKDGSPFVFAGLWEGWKDPATNDWLRTCTIITGEPNEFVREIHTRMPVILPEEYHEAWLTGEAGKEVLLPFPADRMKASPIFGTPLPTSFLENPSAKARFVSPNPSALEHTHSLILAYVSVGNW
jgi:putative SOS response-associated peptidase YedK